jgi:hypothetical protein
MSKIWQLFITYIGLPLLRDLGRWLYNEAKKAHEKRKIVKDQKKKEKAIEDAKTPDEIRSAHRDNRL